MLRTPLCELLGIEHPIIAAPMGPDLTGPELVAAVSNAGGLGILQHNSRRHRCSAAKFSAFANSRTNRSA